jgi:hypothetical protein
MIDDNDAAEVEFTNNWFGITGEANWSSFLPQLKPKRVLEIGSYEGRSVCFLIEKNTWAEELDVHCIDTWEGGVEHKSIDVNMRSVEDRFDANVDLVVRKSAFSVKLTKHKGGSDLMLSGLLANGFSNYFDFVYVDGSHQAKDVLFDAVLAFKLVKVGGVIGFDDYIWAENLNYGKDPLRCPKMAIDAFTNIFFRNIDYMNAVCAQVYVIKVSE